MFQVKSSAIASAKGWRSPRESASMMPVTMARLLSVTLVIGRLLKVATQVLTARARSRSSGLCGSQRLFHALQRLFQILHAGRERQAHVIGRTETAARN